MNIYLRIILGTSIQQAGLSATFGAYSVWHFTQ